MNSYGSVDPWCAVYFGVCFLALISSVCWLCVDAPMSGLHDLCSFHYVGIIKHPGALQVHTRCFVEHSVVDSDGKSLVLGSVMTQSQKDYSLQVHVSAWNSGVSSQGATVPMPANCQARRLL